MAEKSVLEKEGYTVTVAHSGEEALEIVASGGEVNLVLMDIDLGTGISGTDAARQILAQQDIPVVFLSSHTDPAVVTQTEGITSYGYIFKNAGDTVLLASIRMAFRLHQAHRRISWWPRLLEYVVENDRTAIAVLDRDLNFLYVSRRFLESYNVTEVAVIGHNHYEVFPEIPQRWREVHQRALKGEVLRSEEDFFPRRDGSVDFTAWECRPWRDEAGEIGGIILYTEVLTELKQSASFRELYVTLQQGVVFQEAGGRIVSANPAAERILGLTLEQLQGKTSMDPRWQMTTEDGTPVAGADHPAMVALRTGETVGPVVRSVFRPSDESRVWLRITAVPLVAPETTSPYAVHAAFEDITEQIAARESARSSDHRYQLLFESITDAIIVVDAQRRITDCNPGFTVLFGYSRQEVLGRTTAFLLSSEEEYQRLSLEMARHRDGESFSVEVSYRRKSGEVFIGEKRVQYLHDHTGAVTGFIGVVQDIGPRKEREQELISVARERETLMQEVQHRIKNTMNTMTSLLSLQADALADVDAVAALRDAQSRFMSVAVLYDQLYRTEEHSGGSVREYLQQLVHRIVEIFPLNGVVQLQIRIEDFSLAAKELATLGLIITELITNAMKYAYTGRDGGALTVTARRDGAAVELSVADDGPGFTGDGNSSDATGFGLNVVRMLTEQLGGTLRLETDGGARATVRFGG